LASFAGVKAIEVIRNRMRGGTPINRIVAIIVCQFSQIVTPAIRRGFRLGEWAIPDLSLIKQAKQAAQLKHACAIPEWTASTDSSD
jgi:hypothetical protein